MSKSGVLVSALHDLDKVEIIRSTAQVVAGFTFRSCPT